MARKVRSRKRNPYQRHVRQCLKEGMSLKEARKSWKQMKRSVGKKSRGRKSRGRKSARKRLNVQANPRAKPHVKPQVNHR